MVEPIAVDDVAPDFRLKDLQGVEHRLDDMKGRVVVLNFWSASCPWSLKSDEVISGLDVNWDWDEQVVLWRIASNANETEEEQLRVAREREVEIVLRDGDQSVADLYGAITTPHVFVIDSEGKLRYEGALDDSTWRQPEATRNYMVEAVNSLLAGSEPGVKETAARGCTIVRHPVSG